MDQLIERIAATIWVAMGPAPRSWELLHPAKKDQMREVARAVIKEMQGFKTQYTIPVA